MSYLIDTDIIIHSLKGNASVQRHISETASVPKAMSVVTYCELLYGAKRSAHPEKNASTIYRLAEIFPIIGISRSIMESFADLKLSLEKQGRKLEDMDLLIASTALTLNLTLVTNNTKHYQRIKGLNLENWLEWTRTDFA